MTKTALSVVVVTVFATVAVVCALVVTTTLRAPVPGPSAEYTAAFTDVSGLHVGDDVRISGVPVGKVETIQLDGRRAKISFSLASARSLYTNTVAAVRYQNLIGQRYLELVQPEAPGPAIRPGSAIQLDRTIPSFDISKLFNGFRPIFRTIDPAQFNQFGENLLRVVQGDGSGIGPLLRDLEALSKFAADRQAVFVALIRNLGEVSDELGGKSQQVFSLIASLNLVFTALTSNEKEFLDTVDVSLPKLRSIVRVLEYGEHVVDSFTGPGYDFITRIFPHTSVVISGLSLVPSLVQGLRDQLIEGRPATPQFQCAHGMAILPGVGQVSFAEQNLVVCK